MQTDTFAIHILATNWTDLGHPYEWKELRKLVKRVPLTDVVATVTHGDIETYDWNIQKLTLSREASSRLRLQISEKLWFSIRTLKNVFIATYGDTRVYGGVFDDWWSPAAIQFPVIYPVTAEERWIFNLRPTHCMDLAYETLAPDIRQRVEVRDVYERFKRLGSLRQ